LQRVVKQLAGIACRLKYLGMNVNVQINDPVLMPGEYFLVRYRADPSGAWINLPNQTNDPFVISDVSEGPYSLSVRFVTAQGKICPDVIKSFTVYECDEELIPATISESGLYPRTDGNYGIHGTYIYEPGYLVDGTAIIQHHMDNTFWKGRINQVAVWPTPGGGPINVWVGFNFCVTVEETKVYYLAIAADNRFRINVDGSDVLVVDDTPTNISVFNTTTNSYKTLDRQEAFGFRMGIIAPPYTTSKIVEMSAVEYKSYSIFPISLTAGTHSVKITALNTAGPGGMACDIFDNTVEELVAATSIGDLNVVFTTQDQVQFEEGNYVCPSGYVLVPAGSDCEAPMCKKFCGPIDGCECMFLNELYAMKLCNNTAMIYMAFDQTEIGVCQYRVTYTEFGGINPQTVLYDFGQLPHSLTFYIPYSSSIDAPRVKVELICCNGELITCYDDKIINVITQDCEGVIGI
jgi:hypothetical protein